MIFRKRRRVTPQVNITSLIDVVLLLLIFFMISTTFVTQPGIRVNLPNAAASKVNNVAQESNTIVISADNSIFINRQKIRDVQELREILLTMRKEQAGDLIVVKADESVAHGIVVSVMDIAKTSGFSRIAIATK